MLPIQFKWLCLSVIFILVSGCAEVNLFEIRDIIKSKPNLKYFQNLLEILQNSATNFPDNFTTQKHHKKWQVGRVSRKQYEIINMLWRKTNVFGDEDVTTIIYQTKPPRTQNMPTTVKINETVVFKSWSLEPLLTYSPRLARSTSTPSFIEFYYLDDESNERTKDRALIKAKKNTGGRVGRVRNLNDFRFILADAPTLQFHVYDQGYKIPILPKWNNFYTNMTPNPICTENDTDAQRNNKFYNIDPHKRYDFRNSFNNSNYDVIYNSYNNKTTKNENNKEETNTSSSTSDTYTSTDILIPFWDNYDNGNGIFTMNTKKDKNVAIDLGFVSPNLLVQNQSNSPKITTLYDKIKFFETYDKQTPLNYDDYSSHFMDIVNIQNIKPTEASNGTTTTIIESIDSNFGDMNSNLQKPRHSRKLITEIYEVDAKDLQKEVKPIAIANPVVFNVLRDKNNTSVRHVTSKTLFPVEYSNQPFQRWKSNVAKWADYPFVAVYIYEPSQVYCDAAGISPHWLVTAGECLSRHLAHPKSGGQSAFVSYCSNKWWTLERITYVKYSIVHPRFHPKDKTRKHLYNIGLIEVVTSMASACYGWSPISLMSHQFVSETKGSVGYAIGWGLDRFDFRHFPNGLQKVPLMVYENIVYTNACPGNVDFSMSKELESEGGTLNVVCLSLPTYFGEKNDPVHGSMLLVDGKLLALYLQEERRPWGEQSAQYTGTWGLVPWILDITREPEFDPFFSDM